MTITEPTSIPTPLPSQTLNITTRVPNHRTQTVSNPKAKLLATKFPQYFCGAVRKCGDTAVVTMAFPSQLSNSKIDCLLSLSILPNKIQHFAKELFGINVETEGDFRYIIQNNGGRTLLIEVVLLGAQDKAAIMALLGSEASDGIGMSPQRKEEVRQGLLATDCVTLRITGNTHDDGILNLNLGIEKGFELRDALFQ